MAATKTRGKKKNTTKKKKITNDTNGFEAEILLLVILAVCLIILASIFDMGGMVGKAISNLLFGAVGCIAYCVPFLIFIESVYLIIRKEKKGQAVQWIAGIFLLISACAFLHMLFVGYEKSFTLLDYYMYSADHHLGGGVLGGAVVMILLPAFGTVGAYILIVLVMLITLILITRKSFLKIFYQLCKKTGKKVQNGHKEHQQMMQQKKKIQQEKRRQKLEQKDLPESRSFMEGTKLSVFDLNPNIFPEEEKEEDTFEVQSRISDQGQMEFTIQRPEKAERSLEEETEVENDEYQHFLQNTSETKPERKSVKNSRSSEKEITDGIEAVKQEIDQKEQKILEKVYHFPPLKLLKKGSGASQGDSDAHLRKTAQKLQDTLMNFGVKVQVTNVSCGPTVTRYELQPELGVKVSKIVSLTDDIRLNLAASDIRIEAPIPGKAAVGIEVPNKEQSVVMLRDLLQSEEYKEAKAKLSFAVGKDISGKTIITDIAKMPHLLIAGATGSGKSVCINTLIISILYKASPDEVKMIMIDPKVVELSVYNGIPHLLIPVVTDPKKAAGALNWAVTEMVNRYNTFAEYGVRNLTEYNKKIAAMAQGEEQVLAEKMPQILIVVDELADLMMVAPGEVEDAICRLAQLARAAGIHLIIATQRPSVNVITGIIKANMPSRIAFSVSSGVDSRTILDMNGAEKLLGKGDMLFYPQGYAKPARLQGAFISDEEVSEVVKYLSEQHPQAEYDKDIEQKVQNAGVSGGNSASGEYDRDIYFEEAGKFFIEKEKASIGMLQRMFKIGFNRAARIMDQLCDAGVVGPEEGTKPRKVLMTQEEFQSYLEK